MSPFDRIWNGLKSVIQLEGDVARLTAKVEALDVRERETRERLIYLEGVIAVAHERAAAALARRGPTPPTSPGHVAVPA
jgi:hypothetical protein